MSTIKRTLKKIMPRTRNKSIAVEQVLPSWTELLTSHPGVSRDAEFRINMTVSCHDCDYIPKVKNAGTMKTIEGQRYQIMHNGILVESGGYFGDWMAQIIKELKGHHEPQEEKLFYEVLKLIPANSTMIELGSYWSYYSLWFNKAIDGAVNYCCEPDPENLKLGKRNAKINNARNIHFVQSAAGKDDGNLISFKPQEGDRDPVEVPIRSVDGLIDDFSLDYVSIVHMDVQGVELEALKGAEESIKAGKVRFLIISTHHYLISNDLTIHEKCIELIEKWGGHIITEHAIHESFSGDGLILASFSNKDTKLNFEVSSNRLQSNLFRSYIDDLNIIIDAYEKIRKK